MHLCTNDKAKDSVICITGITAPLTLVITTKTLPDNKQIHHRAENNLVTVLSSEKVIADMSQSLSEKLNTKIKVTNIRIGSVKVDLILGDLSRLENLKELSDKWVLTNIVDSILMTPEFIESCQAEDVAIDVVLDEESYQRIKNCPGE